MLAYVRKKQYLCSAFATRRKVFSRIATIGYFDGVHRGHRYLFEQVRHLAEAAHAIPTIYTFYEHPKAVLTGDCPPLLTPAHERFALLEKEGDVRTLFFEQVHHLSAQAFMQRLRSEGVDILLMGYDHRFGSDRLTTFEDYVALGNAIGLRVLLAKEWCDAKIGHVSSSEIRRAIQARDMERAASMLGYTYCIQGKVVRGNAIGRTIGFPTANLAYPAHKLLPPAGVYTGACVVDHTRFPLLLNIGTNPTVGNTDVRVEGHLVGCQADLYGKNLVFSVEQFLREERKFPSLEALKAQLQQDLAAVETR